MDELDNPRQPQIRFSLCLRIGAEPASIKSQLEELVGEELHITDVRSIGSINQIILKCSASPSAYQGYFSLCQRQNLPQELYSLIEDIIPDQDYIPNLILPG
jgi:patatin-like phospholipase/acyl hydrolase